MEFKFIEIMNPIEDPNTNLNFDDDILYTDLNDENQKHLHTYSNDNTTFVIFILVAIFILLIWYLLTNNTYEHVEYVG